MFRTPLAANPENLAPLYNRIWHGSRRSDALFSCRIKFAKPVAFVVAALLGRLIPSAKP